MLQTDRKTETARKATRDPERTRQRQGPDRKLSPAQALQAILSGGELEQLPAESMLSLSQTLGNSALAELISRRETEPMRDMPPLPRGGCETAPADWSGGPPLLTEAPAFGAMAPMGEATPLAL